MFSPQQIKWKMEDADTYLEEAELHIDSAGLEDDPFVKETLSKIAEARAALKAVYSTETFKERMDAEEEERQYWEDRADAANY